MRKTLSLACVLAFLISTAGAALGDWNEGDPFKWLQRPDLTPLGIDICVEIIQQVREIPGVAGVHIMAIEWEEAVPTIVEKAGLLPRPHV